MHKCARKGNDIMENIINTIEATNNNTEKENTNMKKHGINTSGRKGKKVKCLETGEIFKSGAEAAKHFNIKSSSSISEVCLGKNQTAKGLHFEYVNDTEVTDTKANELTPEVAMPEAPIDPNIPKEILVQPKSIVKGKGKRMNGNTKAVFDFSTGNFYTSATDAAEHLNISQGRVSFVCRSKGRTVKGRKLCYVKDINYHLDEIGNAINKANMYDEFTTKEEKRKEMVAKLKSLEAKRESINAKIYDLYDDLAAVDIEIKKVNDEIINFEF